MNKNKHRHAECEWVSEWVWLGIETTIKSASASIYMRLIRIEYTRPETNNNRRRDEPRIREKKHEKQCKRESNETKRRKNDERRNASSHQWKLLECNEPMPTGNLKIIFKNSIWLMILFSPLPFAERFPSASASPNKEKWREEHLRDEVDSMFDVQMVDMCRHHSQYLMVVLGTWSNGRWPMRCPKSTCCNIILKQFNGQKSFVACGRWPFFSLLPLSLSTVNDMITHMHNKQRTPKDERTCNVHNAIIHLFMV